ncbi:hypothetical protein [Streptomyces sp. NPDC006368]|uniref:hypothetical protein n=1 Tax=Streptomyces sp. NPDC006368 TaxID=3156760 RepID=UPI0033AA48B4
MDAAAVAVAPEDARFDARQDSRHGHLADDERGPAELAEWERIDQTLAAAAPGTVYGLDTDDVVHAELAAEAEAEAEAEAAAAAERETAVRQAQRIEARADELQALHEMGTLEQAEPHEGDEAVRDELTRRAGSYVRADAEAWLARTLAAHRGHYADPAAREAAAGLVPAAAPGQLAFAARLAGRPEATADLAALLTGATEPADPTGSLA